ncbi:MAG: hypothetical protein ABSD88_06700 [Candidatus Korobacteraceae bacterium]
MKIHFGMIVALVCFLLAGQANAGDLLITAQRTAQNPPWTYTQDSGVDLNARVLAAWQSMSGSSGPMCQQIWSQIGSNIHGAGSCIRDLEQTGNTCSFDQNPALSLTSSNNTATVTLKPNNNHLVFTTSVQGICLAARSIPNPFKPTDPTFEADLNVTAAVVFSFDGNQLSVNSATAHITQLTLKGKNNPASAVLAMSNISAAINSALNKIVGPPHDFSGLLGPAITQINRAMATAKAGAPAKALQPEMSKPFPPAARFEAASVTVPAGSLCAVHPEGDKDPKHAVHVRAAADGVARFYAVRPTLAGAIERLTLDCTDPAGATHTYAADLRATKTFAPRPFDPVKANLEVRPPLAGDPMALSVKELIARGYGLRPDPKGNPNGYARWLQAASMPAYKASRVLHPPIKPPVRKRIMLARKPSAGNLTPKAGSVSVGSTTCVDPSACYWTGAQLTGSATATQSYIANEAAVNVPTVVPGGFGSDKTLMSIWVGLDNVLQPIVWAQSTSTVASDRIEDELQPANTRRSTAVAPAPGDSVYLQEWYCDAAGNQNLAGGYACTHVTDVAQGLVWDCTLANSSACTSIPITSGFTAGKTAEYIVEDDTPQYGGTTMQWPDFAATPIQMVGSAQVVQNSTGATSWVSTSNDPNVELLADYPSGTPGNSHLSVALMMGSSGGGSGVMWTNVAGNDPATITASPTAAQIPIGMSNVTAITVTTPNAWAGQQTSYEGPIQPFDCVTGPLPGAFGTVAPPGPLPGTYVPPNITSSPQFTFSMALATPVGTTFSDTITCNSIGPQSNQNPSTQVTITATNSDFYISPGFEQVVQGSCTPENMAMMWAKPGEGYCGTISYQIATPPPLPSGITASTTGGALNVCANSSAPLGNFAIVVQSSGCTGQGLWSANAIIDVVPPPHCSPPTCVQNSCQGTISNGCGTVTCPSTCSANYQCKKAMPGQAAICCAPTQIVSNGQCVCANGMTWNPSAGPVGACQPVCSSGKAICAVTGTCMTTIQCKNASNPCPKGAKTGTCM